MAAGQERIVIAEILRPRGNRGEVLARSQTDIPGRIESLRTASAHLLDGSDVALEIAAAWRHQGDWVLKFTGIDSIDAAERFRGADVWVSPADRGTLARGEFFRSDLIGFTLIDRGTGRHLGKLAGWQESGGPLLMEMKIDGREVLIPFAAQVCEVDLAAGMIRVDLPEGLLDL